MLLREEFFCGLKYQKYYCANTCKQGTFKIQITSTAHKKGLNMNGMVPGNFYTFMQKVGIEALTQGNNGTVFSCQRLLPESAPPFSDSTSVVICEEIALNLFQKPGSCSEKGCPVKTLELPVPLEHKKLCPLKWSDLGVSTALVSRHVYEQSAHLKCPVPDGKIIHREKLRVIKQPKGNATRTGC